MAQPQAMERALRAAVDAEYVRLHPDLPSYVPADTTFGGLHQRIGASGTQSPLIRTPCKERYVIGRSISSR